MYHGQMILKAKKETIDSQAPYSTLWTYTQSSFRNGTIKKLCHVRLGEFLWKTHTTQFPFEPYHMAPHTWKAEHKIYIS